MKLVRAYPCRLRCCTLVYEPCSLSVRTLGLATSLQLSQVFSLMTNSPSSVGAALQAQAAALVIPETSASRLLQLVGRGNTL